MKNKDGKLKIGIIDFGMTIKLDEDIKKTLLKVFEIMFNDNDGINTNFIKLSNAVFNVEINIDNYSNDDYLKMNKIIYDMFINIKKGNVTEHIINKTLCDYIKVSKVKNSFKSQVVQLLLSITMANSSVHYLLNNDIKLIEKINMEVMGELLMN